MEREIIKLKGAGDGVKIYLDEAADFSEIIGMLKNKLEEFRRFFGNGHCNIYFLGRKLEKSDILRLESLVMSMLPESTINFGEKRKIQETTEVNESQESTKSAEKTEMEQIRDVVTANFKSNRARFYEGVVRSGKMLESDGHLVLMGDVEHGAKVVATGNIVVLGKLYGMVEAGCMGNKEAYVVAADLNPQSFKIGGVRGYITYEGSGLRKAVLTDNQIFVYEYLSKR